jgi:hypothetical protein
LHASDFKTLHGSMVSESWNWRLHIYVHQRLILAVGKSTQKQEFKASIKVGSLG